MAAPIIITPIVSTTVLEAICPKAVLKSHTPKTTMATQPRIAVVAIGSLSITNSTIHAAKIIKEITSIPIFFLAFVLFVFYYKAYSFCPIYKAKKILYRHHNRF